MDCTAKGRFYTFSSGQPFGWAPASYVYQRLSDGIVGYLRTRYHIRTSCTKRLHRRLVGNGVDTRTPATSWGHRDAHEKLEGAGSCRSVHGFHPNLAPAELRKHSCGRNARRRNCQHPVRHVPRKVAACRATTQSNPATAHLSWRTTLVQRCSAVERPWCINDQRRSAPSAPSGVGCTRSAVWRRAPDDIASGDEASSRC